MMKIERMVSVVLTFAMVISLLPAAFAAGETDYAEKGERTYYTEDIIENATKNTNPNSLKRSADKYVVDEPEFENLYAGMFGEGIPRSARIGMSRDTDYVYCRCCGENIVALYGNNGSGGYSVEPRTKLWKIKCPECKSEFPSNDFASFYELGLQSDGTFDRMQALVAHHNRFASEITTPPGEEGSDTWYAYYGYGKGFLENKLFEGVVASNTDPRTGKSTDGARWGVDDGYGYVSEDGDVHTYIAYYAYYFWPVVRETLNLLANAYMYTKEEKYGIAGGLITDRIADLFPGFDTLTWGQKGYLFSHGGSYRGKIFGRINDCLYTTGWILNTDAFYPIVESEAFRTELQERKGKANLTPETIWQHWADNIIREAVESCKEDKIRGNTGKHQRTLAAAAVVLANEPESQEIIDWIFQDGVLTEVKTEDGKENTGIASWSGGNLESILINNVDRDGMGNESSTEYNLNWLTDLYECAETLAKYKGNEKYNLYKNPKFVKMFTAGIPVTLVDTHTAQIGDAGAVAETKFLDKIATLASGFENIEDLGIKKELAKHIYRLNGYKTDGLQYSIYHPDRKSMASDVAKFIDDDYAFPSEMMTGYGFAVLRDGEASDTASKRDFWMYFGKNYGHGHYDTLNLGIEAFGLNMAPDLGYPETTGEDTNRIQWVMNTISHNTVTVNASRQKTHTVASKPLHFDDTDEVKLMDVDASHAYEDTEIYRRTLVMVNVDDDVSYGVDFFRVKGGNDHIYSFHSQSHEVTTSGLTLMKQDGGTYAGADTAYGEDITKKESNGFTWMKDVSRDTTVGNKAFAVDFDITDYRGVLSDSKGIHLRMTMLNDFDLSEVAITSGYVPIKSSNKKITDTTDTLKYVLARRQGSDLDSLFTTVYEPYRNERYISSISKVEVSPAADTVKAVKVVRTDGRVDYVVYATDNSVLYTVTDGNTKFNFRGFVGVYSLDKDGNNIYSYVNDGDVIGKYDSFDKKYTGTVSDFTKGLTLDNSITITTSDDVDTESLAGKYVYVENDGEQNGVYKIESATKSGDTLKLDIGEVSLIRSTGYTYNIAEGQSVTIPLSTEVEIPKFEQANSNTFGKQNGFIRNMRENDGTYSLYLFAGIDSLNYRKAGFRVTHDGVTKDFTTTDVYSEVEANNGKILPSDFGANSLYIFAIKLLGFAGFEKNKPVFFQPFAINYDESRVYGEATEVKEIMRRGWVNNE